MNTIKAKFKCSQVTKFEVQKHVKLHPVTSKEGENADYAKATPGGNLELVISNETKAANFFEPGKEYRVTITEVESESEEYGVEENIEGRV